MVCVCVCGGGGVGGGGILYACTAYNYACGMVRWNEENIRACSTLQRQGYLSAAG